MAKKNKQSTWGVISAVLIAIVIWYLKNHTALFDENQNVATDGDVSITKSGKVEFDVTGLTEVKSTDGKYHTLEGCELVDYRNNDGDSFMVKHPKLDGGKSEVRLYFVDTAESRLHRKNGKRIAEQGAYFGGLSQKQTTEIGIVGKKLTLGMLAGKKFTMLTKWEMDPSGQRPHVFVLIENNGKHYYLHEILARSGLVRTITRGAPLPDGTGFYIQRDKVRALENQAKKAKRGAWAISSNSQ